MQIARRTVRRYMFVAKNYSLLLKLLEREGFIANRPRAADLESPVVLLRYISPSRAVHLLAEERKSAKGQRGKSDSTTGASNKKQRAKRKAGSAVSDFPANWLTPRAIIDCALRLWGAIDLDPCAEVSTTPNIPASKHYTERDRGENLQSPWSGRVFMNPGESQLTHDFVNRALLEFENETCPELLLVLPAVLDSLWHREVSVAPHAFVRERMHVARVNRPKLRSVMLPHGLMIVFLGPPERWTAFAQAFQSVADVYRPWNQLNLESA